MIFRSVTRVGRLRRAEPSGNEVISEVNLTPLVDMALTLIVVFLIFLPTLTTLIPISSTSTSPGPNGGQEKIEAPLVLILSADKVRLGNLEFTSDEKLIPWLRDLYAKRHDHKIIVKTQGDVPQQRLVSLLDTTRATGEWKLSLSLLNPDRS
jgi:biopolymer transport protein ExbD